MHRETVVVCDHCGKTSLDGFTSVRLAVGGSWSPFVNLCLVCGGQAFQALLENLDEAERAAWLAMWGKRKGEKP